MSKRSEAKDHVADMTERWLAAKLGPSKNGHYVIHIESTTDPRAEVLAVLGYEPPEAHKRKSKSHE